MKRQISLIDCWIKMPGVLMAVFPINNINQANPTPSYMHQPCF